MSNELMPELLRDLRRHAQIGRDIGSHVLVCPSHLLALIECAEALSRLVTRCDGDEGVQTDGSNIDTCEAHAALAKLEAL